MGPGTALGRLRQIQNCYSAVLVLAKGHRQAAQAATAHPGQQGGQLRWRRRAPCPIHRPRSWRQDTAPGSRFGRGDGFGAGHQRRGGVGTAFPHPQAPLGVEAHHSGSADGHGRAGWDDQQGARASRSALRWQAGVFGTAVGTAVATRTACQRVDERHAVSGRVPRSRGIQSVEIEARRG